MKSLKYLTIAGVFGILSMSCQTNDVAEDEQLYQIEDVQATDGQIGEKSGPE